MANHELQEGVYRIADVFPTPENIQDAKEIAESGSLPFLAVVYEVAEPSTIAHNPDVQTVLDQLARAKTDHTPVMVRFEGEQYIYYAMGDKVAGMVDDHLFYYIPLPAGKKISLAEQITWSLQDSLRSVFKKSLSSR